MEIMNVTITFMTDLRMFSVIIRGKEISDDNKFKTTQS